MVKVKIVKASELNSQNSFLAQDYVTGIECPNCDDGTDMSQDPKDKDHYTCPTCDYAEQR